MPFSIHTMNWSHKHCSFVVTEEFIQNGGSPIMTQRAFRIRFALDRRDPVLDNKKFTIGCQTSDKQVLH
jgi:hypothetical protein